MSLVIATTPAGPGHGCDIAATCRRRRAGVMALPCRPGGTVGVASHGRWPRGV